MTCWVAGGAGRRLARLTLPRCDRDVLRPADRAGLRVCPGPRKHVARHRAVDGQLAGTGDEVFADRPRRRDRELPSDRGEILLDGAAHRQRPAGDPRVATDRPGDVDAATGREDVTRDGPRDVDQATACDQVTVDGAIDPDRPGERVDVIRDGLAGRDGHRVAGPKLVAHGALGKDDAGQHRKQGDACGGRHERGSDASSVGPPVGLRSSPSEARDDRSPKPAPYRKPTRRVQSTPRLDRTKQSARLGGSSMWKLL